MRNHRHIIWVCVASLLAAAGAVALEQRGDQDKGWKAVDDAMSKGLPKTAIQELEPIIARALKQKNHAEASRAIAQKIALQGQIEGNRPEEKLPLMQAQVDQAPEAMKPILQAILANWYWDYFRANRWRFLQRTQTSAPPGDDITTWDLARILAEIDRQFTRAFDWSDVLQKTPIAEYDALLEKGNQPDAYRPTLYDFVVHNALEFYQAGEQAGARAEEDFELLAGSPIFAEPAEFLAWDPGVPSNESRLVHAVRLYQDLLRFHQNDDDRSAFLGADLLRLQFGYNTAVGEEKNARYKAALRRFAEANANHEISSRALAALASVLLSEESPLEAREMAQQGERRFPGSVGSTLCHNLIQQLQAPELAVDAERVWNEPWPAIHVSYRNVARVHFRVVPYDYEAFFRSGRYHPDQFDDTTRKTLLSTPAALEWSTDLRPTTDLKTNVQEVPAPEGLKPGCYVLIASKNAAFDEPNNLVALTEVWVSKLAVVVRGHGGEGVIDGFVLDAKSGSPIEGAVVRALARDNQGRIVSVAPTQTDANGMFRFQSKQQFSVWLHASHEGQSLGTYTPQGLVKWDKGRSLHRQTIFFTDRAIYRPGQIIQFKGICIETDPDTNQYRILKGQQLQVVLHDANGNEIERVKVRANDYGSFSGSVAAPRDRLMGAMTLSTKSGPEGSCQVRVEEYKRPKFQVKLDAPAVPARLNGEVELKGRATSYTGAPIDGGKVLYRVVREVRFPPWWAWRWFGGGPAESQEIGHGTATTGADGSFTISFAARPDPRASAEGEPVFHYSVSADVTDSAGETRSASRSVNVGYTALAARLQVDTWQANDTPVAITLTTQSLDDEPQPAEGTLEVYRLVQPETPVRPPLSNAMPYVFGSFGGTARPDRKPDPANLNSWELGERVHESAVTTDASGKTVVKTPLEPGIYRAIYKTTDRFGKAVKAEQAIHVLNPGATHLADKIPYVFTPKQSSVEPGGEFVAVWGSGYDTARAFIEIEHRGQFLKRYWTEPGVTQQAITQHIEESMRGGLSLRVTMIRENRANFTTYHVDVPWSNKNLKLTWEHFVSKLEPGQKESWTALVKGPNAENASAEMVASLYDASLDAYASTNWPHHFQGFYYDNVDIDSNFANTQKSLVPIINNISLDTRNVSIEYRHFPHQIVGGSGWQMDGVRRFNRYELMPGAPAPMAAEGALMSASALPMGGMGGMGVQSKIANFDGGGEGHDSGGEPPKPDLSMVSARKNLNETAFFFPQLRTGEDGSVRMEFTMPEALTEWRFLGFAHDTQLRAGFLTDSVVTARDLMVQPNAPRFLREGDSVAFSVKITNKSAARQSGTARLTFADAATLESADAGLQNSDLEKSFDIPAGESSSLSWTIRVPDGQGFLIYKAVASTGRVSDGEEGYLPVLPRRVLVQESLALPLRGKGTREFAFDRLIDSAGSDSLQNTSLTVQMVSNPSWYAVMALPYLMEYPYECSEQTFNRLYANALARHIALSDPRIERVFETWRQQGGDTLDSPLEKNQDLKSVALEETPWVRQAESESQARRNVGVLFDKNRLDSEVQRLISRLDEQQLDDGRWPWFPGGPADDYITLYIVTGFGRMRHLGVRLDVAPAVEAVPRLDAWMTELYTRIKPADRDQNHLSALIAFYLYGRSFFLADQPVDAAHKEAVEYWLSQARKYWLPLDNRQSQAHLALALKRFADPATARDIVASLKERSVSSDEMGMYWRDTERSWWWYRAPIETQAMMIEVFDEVAADARAVEDCQVWLLKQKQTQDWKTTKATADAVYALLLRGSNLLASNTPVELALGGQKVEPARVEAGTGFYEKRFAGNEIRPELGKITAVKTDDGVAWGSVHWQYLEDMARVTPSADSPLQLTKQLYTKVHTNKGPTLERVEGPVHVGDELVVRVVLKTDRDLEYVHLKDYRGSGTEPVNVLSSYRFQDGLGYYESTRDTASHFFIHSLPRGTYVFEYSVRVQLKGSYQTGFASIECMYAPEFKSHSESLGLTVE